MGDLNSERGIQHEAGSAAAAFRAIFEQSAVGMAQVGVDGSWLRVNQRLCDMLGYTRAELLQYRFADLTHPDDVGQDLQQLQLMLAGDESTYDVEKRYMRKDGSQVWVKINTALVRDDSGVPQYFVTVVEDVTEQHDAQAAVQASELRFATVFRTSPDAVHINRLSDGLYVAVNEGFASLTGFSSRDVMGRTSIDLGVWKDIEERSRLVERLRSDGQVRGFEAEFGRKDGSVVPVLISARIIDIDGEECILHVTTDVSQLKAADEHIRRLNRVYAVLGGVNKALVHRREPQAIFDEACRVIVEEGGFSMAWVGMVAPDKTHVRAVAQAGGGEDYVGNLDVVLDDQSRGGGPSGAAINEQRPVVIPDIEHDPRMAPWRDRALAHGYRSAAALPLIVDDAAVGAFTLYACEPRFFDQEQVALLDELAANISFALTFAKEEERRQRAETELGLSEAKFSTVFRASPDAQTINRLSDGAFVEINEAFTKLSGYTEADVEGKTTVDLAIWPDPADRTRLVSSVLEDGLVSNFEARMRRKDGSSISVLMSAREIDVAGERCILGASRDITDLLIAQESLRESERTYRTVAENVSDVVWILDPKTLRFLYVSPSVERLRGFTPEEVMAEPMDAALTPEGSQMVRDLIVRRMNEFLSGNESPERSWVEEVEQPRKDGSTVWTEVVTSFHRNEVTGEPEILGLSRDIGERKRLESAQIENETRLQALLDNAPYGAHMYELEADGRLMFTGYNRRAEEILGFDHAPLLGKTLEEAFPGNVGTETPDGYRRVAREGGTWEIDQYAYDAEGIAGVFDVFAFSFGPNRVSVFFRDITARRKLEIAVAESEERYQRLFDSMLEGFAYCKMIYDDEGRAVDWLYLDANPAFSRLTGLRDVVGKRVLEVLPTTRADNPELLEAYERVAATGEPEEFEIDFRPLDMSLRVTALCPEPGHFVAIFENITARKTAENALLDTNLRLERMVYDVAESMGRIVEYRDPYTQGHEERVTEIARLLAQKMNLSEEEIAGIEMAAIVHDIGKLAVPAEILTKPGALSPIEFALIREHPAAGYGILKDIAFPWPVSDIVLQHHERLDGSGYPNGLAGEEICLGARIVAVADVVEAMASHRPYRPARGLAAALDEVTTKPELYDAAVVSALAELCDTGAVQL